MIQKIKLESNTKTHINFDGGDLSSDSGILIIQEFLSKLGFKELLKNKFIIKGDYANRTYSNAMMLYQQIMLMIAGYHNQSDATALKDDPAFKECFESLPLASQANFSRFIKRLNAETEKLLEEINEIMLDTIFEFLNPDYLLFDIDSTHFQTYGEQESRDYNAHYQAEGYHPIMVFEAFTGFCLRSQLRSGNSYTSIGVADFMRSILEKYEMKYPDLCRLLRGDSGFATPELYDLCEDTGTDYVIRLKENRVLGELAAPFAKLVMDEKRLMESQIMTGEFIYQAKSWRQPRRVVVQVKRKAGKLDLDYLFIVTTLKARQDIIIKTYAKRGTMENFIKECKNDFRMDKVSHKEFIANANRMQIGVLSYNLMITLKILVLPEKFKKMQTCSLRTWLFKVAARKVKRSGYVIFKACSHFIYQDKWLEIFENIKRLKLRIE